MSKNKKPFIVFHTEAQVKNYISRQYTHSHNEGCGCCYGEVYTMYDEKSRLVFDIACGAGQGTPYFHRTIVGRLR